MPPLFPSPSFFVLSSLSGRPPCSRSCARVPLVGVLRPSLGRAITHAPCVALATLGRAVGTFFVGWRTALRFVRYAVSHRCSCPMFARVASSPSVRRAHTFCGGSCRPRPPLCGGGLSRPALPRAPSWAVFFIVSPEG